MNRLQVIQRIIDKISAKTYIEIGVGYGEILLNVKAESKVGVDPQYYFSRKKNIKLKLGIDKEQMFKMTSDLFFEKHAADVFQNGIDVAFVDGMHTYKYALRDVENCLKYLNEGGVIVVHDCNPLNFAIAYPINESYAEMQPLIDNLEIPGYNGQWLGDVWKTLAHLRIAHKDLNIFTLDLDWGMGIITRGESKPLEGYTFEDIENGDYYTFETDRENILNLKHPKYLLQFLDTLSPVTRLNQVH